MQEASCSEQDLSVVLGYNLSFCMRCFAGKRGWEGCERQSDEHTDKQSPLHKRWQQQVYEREEMRLIIRNFWFSPMQFDFTLFSGHDPSSSCPSLFVSSSLFVFAYS